MLRDRNDLEELGRGSIVCPALNSITAERMRFSPGFRDVGMPIVGAPILV